LRDLLFGKPLLDREWSTYACEDAIEHIPRQHCLIDAIVRGMNTTERRLAPVGPKRRAGRQGRCGRREPAGAKPGQDAVMLTSKWR
jgi:hypothetical protein